jgi:hypothetical protein
MSGLKANDWATAADLKARLRRRWQRGEIVASAIRDAAREDRQRRAEVETVRAGLQKLQAIRV